MTIKLNAKQSQLDGLAVNSVKLVTAVAVFLVLMTSVIGSVAQVRAFSRSTSSELSNGPHTVLPGMLRAARNAAVFVDYPSYVKTVTVAPGDVVEEGQLLAVLESPEITLAANRAEGRFLAARERLQDLRRRGGEDIAAKIRREEYEAAERTWNVARKRVESFDLETAREAHRAAKERTAQMKSLLSQHLITAAELEQSLKQEQVAVQTLQANLEHYSRLKQEVQDSESRLRISQMRVDEYEGSEARAARRAFDEAKVDHELAQRRLSDLQLVAPRPGTVLKVNVAAGDRVVSGAPLMSLSDLSSLHAEVPVSAKVARQIAVGTPVEVRVPTDPPREVNSAVQSVLLVPDATTQGYLVQIRISNPEPGVILAGLDCAVVFPHLETGESWLKRLF